MLSTKHLVSNRGHNAHARQHRFIGFLKFWRLPLNIVYGYSVSVGCMVCSCVFRFGCVSSNSVVSAIGFNLARTIFCFRERLFLYACVACCFVLLLLLVWPCDRAEVAAVLLPALADLKHAILAKSVLAHYSYAIPLGNCVLGLVSRIPLGTAPAN